jgi:hypothetical protein
MAQSTLRFITLLGALWWGGVAAGCGSSGEVKLCGQIPPGGCPLGRGGTCADPVCTGLYDCPDGSWVLVESCGAVAGSNGEGGAGGGGGAGSGGCDMVTIDKTGESTGCKPDLQSPDCPAAAVETCVESACLTECSDFFLCTKDGWADVAHCSENGELTLVTPSARAPSREFASPP